MSKTSNIEHIPRISCHHLIIYLFIIGLISLLGVSLTISSHPIAAASVANRWTKVNIPAGGEAGRWVLAAGSDIQRLTADGEGTLYAYVKGPPYTLYRSVDGGYHWEHIGNVGDAIIDIAISPQDVQAIYYATSSMVYGSFDGGRTFQALPANPGDAGIGNKEITSIDVVRMDRDIVVVSTRDMDSGEYGGVYILNEADVVPTWTDTSIGSYDVAAVAFSPYYRDNGQIMAVATDETSTFINMKNGDDGWNAEIGYARLDIAVAAAELAFPATDNANEPVAFVAIDTGTGQGDVYKFIGSPAPGISTAIDLNAGSVYGSNDIDISGLSVYDDNGTVTLLAGAADSAMTYVSTDSGTTWTPSLKPPTGGSATGVLIGPDFGTTGQMYAATSGDGSAFSVSRDLGASWNQLSLVDTAIDTIVDLAPSPRYEQDSTIFMLTFGSGPYSGGLWRSLDSGDSWERTFSDSPDSVGSLSRVALPPEYGDNCQTVFVAGSSLGNTAIFESTNNGQTYRRRFTRTPSGGGSLNIDTWFIVDKTTVLVGSFDGSHGMVYKSINRGFTFARGLPAGGQPLHSLALSPDYALDGTVLVGNSDGQVYLSDNGATSFELLSGDTITMPFSGAVTVAFDPSFSKNQTVYAVCDSPDSGIYRFVIGKSTAWESIDDSLPAGAVFNQLTVSADGTFYAANAAAGGGLERSLNPTSASPAFETITRGLTSSATLYGLWQADRRIWSLDTTSSRLMTYEDTLTSPPVPVLPADGASAMGNLVDHTVRNVALRWESMEGVNGYEWECSFNNDFTADSVVFGDSTSGNSVHLPALEPATTYFWRVRASSPALSPWSERQSFTTVMDIEPVTLRPESPAPGATGVPLKPVFQWTAVVGAEAYELLIATDADMADPIIDRTGQNALAGNAWQCDVSLDYATTYFWKVRAVNATTSTAWGTLGVFTTEAAPPSPETPTVLDNEIVGRPANLDTVPVISNPATAQIGPTPTMNGTVAPNLNEQPGLSNWIIYLIGGLLTAVILTLIVVLVMVIKLRRIT